MEIKDRGIWTWGHVIYDYRSFFRNMSLLQLNRIVIWNDILPLNAEEVLAEAHRYGIKVVWGFSWGWMDKCGENVRDIGDRRITTLKKSILSEFEEYRSICADGIYFQSFTETDLSEVGGISIAETVVGLVNSVSAEIFSRMPNIEIEFGLHATSVKKSLDIIAKTDPRVRIVWEDCGAFPFDYDPNNTDGFDETYEFTKKLITLRGRDEKCGFVIKGMTKLDWSTFEYHTEPYEISTASPEFIKNRAKEKEPLWNYIEDGWNRNSEYARKILELAASNEKTSVHALIEDGMFEYEIKKPARLFSQMTRRPDKINY